MTRWRSVALAATLLVTATLDGSEARADRFMVYRSRLQGPGTSTRQALELSLARVRETPLGPAARRQLARMFEMAGREGVIAADGTWLSAHLGNTLASDHIVGVFDPARKIFRGFHQTARGELVSITLGGSSDGAVVAVKDGATPLIGAGRHTPRTSRPGTTVLRSWSKENRPAGSKRAALTGGQEADSVALELRYEKGQPVRRRVHLLLSEHSGLVDAGFGYETVRDAHTGEVQTRDRRLGETRINVEGQDPWRED